MHRAKASKHQTLIPLNPKKAGVKPLPRPAVLLGAGLVGVELAAELAKALAVLLEAFGFAQV